MDSLCYPCPGLTPAQDVTTPLFFGWNIMKEASSCGQKLRPCKSNHTSILTPACAADGRGPAEIPVQGKRICLPALCSQHGAHTLPCSSLPRPCWIQPAC